MTEIYFIRHSKTTFIASEYERSLSNEGILEINKLEMMFENCKLDKAYCSPYKRSIQTIDSIVKRKGIEMILLDNLRERETGADFIEDFEAFVLMQWNDFDYKLPNGESIRDTQLRAVATLNQILQNEKSKTLLIGTHGTFLSALINYYDESFGYNNWLEMKMPEVYKFDYSGLEFKCFERLSID